MNIEFGDFVTGVVVGVLLYGAVKFARWCKDANDEDNYLHICKCLAPVPWIMADSPLVVTVMHVEDLYLLVFDNGKTSGWMRYEDAATMQQHMTQFEFMVHKSDLDAHGITIEMLRK